MTVPLAAQADVAVLVVQHLSCCGCLTFPLLLHCLLTVSEAVKKAPHGVLHTAHGVSYNQTALSFSANPASSGPNHQHNERGGKHAKMLLNFTAVLQGVTCLQILCDSRCCLCTCDSGCVSQRKWLKRESLCHRL